MTADAPSGPAPEPPSGAPGPRSWGSWLLPVAVVFAGVALAQHVSLLAPVRPYAAPVLMLYLPFLWSRRLSLADVGLASAPRRGWLAAAASAAVFLGGFYLVTRFALWGAWGAPAQGWGARLFAELLFAALPEEVFFRGWLQPRAERLAGGRALRLGGLRITAGNAVTAAAFAAIHLAAVPAAGRLSVFFPGLWFGWLRTVGGSIWPAIVLHAVSNLLMAAALAG